MERQNGGNCTDWFFMAMAHGRLGNEHDAQKWYGQAVEWMEKNDPDDESLRRLRAEAAELLGIAEPISPSPAGAIDRPSPAARP